MSEFWQAFALGNAAILGNVCLLPLYPGLFVMLAERTARGGSRRSVAPMGVLVLAGIVTFMVVLGFALHQVSRSVADVLDVVLPALYLAVAALGVAMLLDRNPLARLGTGQAPILRSPNGTAFLYGMFLAPMTLPCTGPLVVSAFVIGGVGGTGALVDSLAYFLWFSLGFGWPLVLLPFLALPAQRRITSVLARHHRVVTLSSGVLLVGIAVFGWWTELGPGTVWHPGSFGPATAAWITLGSCATPSSSPPPAPRSPRRSVGPTTTPSPRR